MDERDGYDTGTVRVRWRPEKDGSIRWILTKTDWCGEDRHWVLREVDGEEEIIAAAWMFELCGYVLNDNAGIDTDRLQFNPRERAFADEWAKENVPHSGMSSGCGMLQNLFIRVAANSVISRPIMLERITKRDRLIVGTVVQWLGSNVGMSFLHASLRRCGYRIEKIEEADRAR